MSWVEKHSINCIVCNALVDERECPLSGPGNEGQICPECGNVVIPTTDFYDEVAFLTNACCEIADPESAIVLQALGLAAGQWQGEFYPLTDAETQFVREDISVGGDVLSGGYSALCKGRKFFCPVMERNFYVEDVPNTHGYESRATVLEAVGKTFYRAVQQMREIGGFVNLAEDDGPLEDRHTLHVLIPVEYVLKTFEGYEQYHQWLATFYTYG